MGKWPAAEFLFVLARHPGNPWRLPSAWTESEIWSASRGFSITRLLSVSCQTAAPEGKLLSCTDTIILVLV